MIASLLRLCFPESTSPHHEQIYRKKCAIRNGQTKRYILAVLCFATSSLRWTFLSRSCCAFLLSTSAWAWAPPGPLAPTLLLGTTVNEARVLSGIRTACFLILPASSFRPCSRIAESLTLARFVRSRSAMGISRSRYDAERLRIGRDHWEMRLSACAFMAGETRLFFFGVEKHDATESRVLKSVRIDEHLSKNLEKRPLDVQRGKRLVTEGLKPEPNGFEKVLIDDGLR